MLCYVILFYVTLNVQMISRGTGPNTEVENTHPLFKKKHFSTGCMEADCFILFDYLEENPILLDASTFKNKSKTKRIKRVIDCLFAN